MENKYLNSYVFEQVFGKCKKLCAQVRLARAFPQYVAVATRIWSISSVTNTIGPYSYAAITLTCLPDYLFFMRNMAPHFRNFHMLDYGPRSFELYNLEKYLFHLECSRLEKFTSVTICKLTGLKEAIQDEDILQLTKMMPNLKAIHIECSSYTGTHLENFKNLDELHLGDIIDNELETKTHTIQNIVTKMQNLRVLNIRGNQLELKDIDLPNLEVLTIDIQTLSHIMEQVMILPRLQNLTIYGKQNNQQPLFEKVLKEKASKITGVCIDNSLLKLAEDWDNELSPLAFPKLRKLVFEHWNYSKSFLSGHKFDRGQIKTIACDHWKCLGEDELKEMIKEHHNLQKICIRNCGIGKESIKSIELLLKHENTHINNFRKTSMISSTPCENPRPKLFVWDFCNFWVDLNPEEITYWQNNQYVEIQPANHRIYLREPYSFKFEFETT